MHPDEHEQARDGDVETLLHRGHWITRVVGRDGMSHIFSNRAEAVEAGRDLAEQFGTKHLIRDDDGPRTRVSPPGIEEGRGMPPTTDADGIPFDNPSG
ncbi:MAG TPA: DUF2188 domain-containing protein [Microbacterium sp.]|uniref:DUF2188 domain-containing protein n=1 Tax=Microbacterium sp. TaxID=51671 RepID=UPI002B4A240C|nr:DUF2188 domain-containing protein [Microbacterium sp.]HKT56930.1 DUF2188 domain-containing protein [Microbacterium sp.]